MKYYLEEERKKKALQEEQDMKSSVKSHNQKYDKIAKDFLSENAKNNDVFISENGLQYKILTKGKRKHPKKNDFVLIDFEFSSIPENIKNTRKGVKIRVSELGLYLENHGDNSVLEKAMQEMTEGSEYIFYLPNKLNEDYSYKKRYALLLWQVKLIEINP